MTSQRTVTVLLVFALLSASVLAGCSSRQQPESEGQVHKWELKYAATDVEGDYVYENAVAFADDVREWSNGNVDITVYPYGALGEQQDIMVSTATGVLDLTTTDFGWTAGLVPEMQVTSLPYLFPRERTGEVMEWIAKNGDFLNVLGEIYREKGLELLGWSHMGWTYLSSNKPIEKMTDMQGLKLRLQDSALLFDLYGGLGASPTSIPYGEIYGGLQMGMIDGQMNPMYSVWQMGFYEVQDYVTQIWATPFVVLPAINADLYDSLPQETQQYMKEWFTDNTNSWIEWGDQYNKDCEQQILEKRPKITVTYLDDERTAEFKEASSVVHDKFKAGEYGGKRTEEVYEALVRDIEQAKQALSIE